MCGLVGFWDCSRSADADELRATATAMADRLHHRGPDSAGVWTDAVTGLALGFKRLAIIDLSPQGHQPMKSASERWVMVFNGEIYNYPDLRKELEALGCRFRGQSDTEVLLAAVERWGVRAALERTVGMFALAVFDRHERALTLARDRLGKKPLYFGWQGKTLMFGSELKAFAAHPKHAPTLDRAAVKLLFKYQYVPAPHSIWQGIYKLPAAGMLTLRLDAADPPRGQALLERVESYWSLRHVAEAGVRARLPLAEEAVLEETELRLADAVSARMIADVPLGAFLSGGIDSSLVVALMQQQSSRPVQTFALGFDDARFDEAVYARQVADHLGTDHTDLLITPDEACAVIPDMADIYDEPFSDPSQILAFLVSRLARQAVTVCLSGDGGDEVFGGYGRYFLADRMERLRRPLPAWLRRLGARAIQSQPAVRWDVLLRHLPSRLPYGLIGGISGDRLHKLATLLAAEDRDALYEMLVSVDKHARPLVLDAETPTTALADASGRPAIEDYVLRMMFYDSITYLPDDILAKVDRASMAVSLEVRTPLLDHRLVEHAWRLPRRFKVRDGEGKWILRRLFERHLPSHFADRPKHGFSLPVADWLRGPLHAWADDLLDPVQLRKDGILDAAGVRQIWIEHQAGDRNWGQQLWTLLMFQAWRQRWLEPGFVPTRVAAA